MRELRRAWPLAGVLFVSLAGAEIIRADEPAPEGQAENAVKEPAPISIRLFGRTWCLGQPADTVCDFRLPLAVPKATRAAASEKAPSAESETAGQGGAFQKFLEHLKSLFSGARKSPGAAAAPSTSG